MKMMFKIMFLALAIVCIACTQDNPISVKEKKLTIEQINSNSPFVKLAALTEDVIKKPYEIKFEVEEVMNSTIDLIIKIELEEGAFFASPFENDHLKGRFQLSLGEEKAVAFTDKLTEEPLSKTVIDKYAYRPTNWVNQNTTYTQTLELKTKDDFEVYGNVKFVIEPNCTMEEIPFRIYKKNGKLFIEENPDC